MSISRRTVIRALATAVPAACVGNLMLNIPLRGDGTIDSDEERVLDGLGEWMAVNGEGIYGTRPFHIYGEGPASATSQPKGQFAGVRDVRKYGPQDVRFTIKGDAIYAFLMGWPDGGKSTIRSLALGGEHYTKKIGKVELLGHGGPLQFTHDTSGLTFETPSQKPGDHAYCLKILPA